MAEKNHAGKVWIFGCINPGLVHCWIFNWDGSRSDHLDAAIDLILLKILKQKVLGYQHFLI